MSPSKAKAYPALYGVYRSTDCPDNIVHYVHVGLAGENFPPGFVRIVSIGQPKNPTTALGCDSFVGFVEQCGQYHVLHIPLANTANPKELIPYSKEKWNENEVKSYIIVRLSVTDDSVEMSDLNEAFISTQISANKLNGVVKQRIVQRKGIAEIGEKTLSVSADTDELRIFFRLNIDGKLFNNFAWKFTRLK